MASEPLKAIDEAAASPLEANETIPPARQGSSEAGPTTQAPELEGILPGMNLPAVATAAVEIKAFTRC